MAEIHGETPKTGGNSTELSGSGAASKSTAATKSPMMSRLGRGLGALIPPAMVAAPKPASVEPASKPIDRMPLNTPQPGADSRPGAVPSAKVAAMPESLPRVPAPIQSTTAPSPAKHPSPRPRPSGESKSDGSTGNTPVRTTEVKPQSGGDANLPQPSTPRAGEAIEELQISLIARNMRQPRERFDERALKALGESIQLHGLIQPIVVRRLTVPRGTKRFELIAGERRMRAFEAIGRSTIPAIIRTTDDASSAALALIENVQREDLNPIERAVALKRLITDFSWTQQQAGDRIGLDRASVANLLRLNELDAFTSSCVREGQLSQGHAKALLSIADPAVRRAIAERSLHDEWSVRQVEREVQRLKSAAGLAPIPVAPSTRHPSAQISDLEKRLGTHLGTKVTITKGRKPGTGTLSIDFYSLAQFDGILDRLNFDANSLND